MLSLQRTCRAFYGRRTPPYALRSIPREVKVRFEGRTIVPSDGGFVDEFGSPQTVHVYEIGE